ncbi:hypothetical protein [Lactobacillus crispatus]|uniref:MarR family transcriptional regulator n=1 Tax=Lactobacillus crispatus TaxID=47770 RepID=A0AAW8WU75_9LACO|nr:hypothetical protein [Lactobacillus crispatus]STX18353.1 Uncharacterised protein [Lactobacillus acidophilus]MCT7731021.1 hypothetical protein [Lactobacillus crispatus]MCT7802348.1 hypothetical protein [Lactobacillus crispatus]MCT7808002.1 hypothetical protein [Lactobacillus crispatus]MCT7816593.1 hypothetical protein [Lactobacillus crispatus]
MDKKDNLTAREQAMNTMFGKCMENLSEQEKKDFKKSFDMLMDAAEEINKR